MARYILIENNSGRVFGDSADFNGKIFTGTALEFAQALDESIDPACVFSRVYIMRFRAYDSRDVGYHVYRANIDGSEAVPVVREGQSQEEINTVLGRCRYKGFIRVTRKVLD